MTDSRFVAQASTAEDLLSSQTVGLVHLNDYRKRRADALDQKDREAHDRSQGRFTPGGKSGQATPSDGASTPQRTSKKAKKNFAKGKLSFGLDDGEEDNTSNTSQASTPKPDGPLEGQSRTSTPALEDRASPEPTETRKRLGPNQRLSHIAPKVMTKASMMKEAQTREQLRKEFLFLQETVQATEMLIPFVFYDGTNIPGGISKVKKGDFIWVFLDRARKVGAELGVGGGGGGGGERSSNRREWARVGVDDLMLVKGEIIIPHHYKFHHFIINKTLGHGSVPLFPYSAQAPMAKTSDSRSGTRSPSPALLSRPIPKAKRPNPTVITEEDKELEGYDFDPNTTKVVDRRWYERNKHIFPASVWEEFDPTKDYTKALRRDAEGNTYFFS
ncbi:hypothetical protein MMC25_007829 [Agyrium rufum]|nr:hypothetical protein [Agyrium rufum]